MMVRFATVCDSYGCGRRSEEYSAWPTCRGCDRDVCDGCRAHTFDDADVDRNETCLCRECWEHLADEDEDGGGE